MYAGGSKINFALLVSHTYGRVSLTAALEAQEKKQRAIPANRRKKTMLLLLILKRTSGNC